MGLTLENAHKDMLGSASKVVITKDSTLIVTDGSTRTVVSKRVSQIQNLVEVCHLWLRLLDSQVLMMDLEVVLALIDTQVSHQFANMQLDMLKD